MSLFHVLGFGLKVGHLVWLLCCSLVSLLSNNWVAGDGGVMGTKASFLGDGGKVPLNWLEKFLGNVYKIHQHYYQGSGSKKVGKTWWRKLFFAWIMVWSVISLWVFWGMSSQAADKRKETLVSMCDERARMLQDQFNVSMNHVQAMSILISTFHHGKYPSAIDQATFARYTERTAFERPLTSGVAYAVKVLHSEREEFERQQGWKIKRMDAHVQKPVHKDNYEAEVYELSPVQEEYAPVIFAQDTISHIISLDMLSGKEDRENILRARDSGKGVLTAPFRLLKTNSLGVILTFAVYKKDLLPNATPEDRIKETYGYLGGVFHIESLVEKLLQQLASKQTIVVNVYDITNHSHPISMYGSDVSYDVLEHVSSLNFGDPFRMHEMRCRFKLRAPLPWLAIFTSIGILVIALLIGHIFYATMNRIAKVEDDFYKMMGLKKRAEDADVAKSQFLATVSHEIRTPMNGVLGMLHMLMDTNLDITQQDYVRTAQASGKALVSLMNEVLDQAKIESGKIELEAVQFDVRSILDDVLSLFSGKSQDKVELAAFISDKVPSAIIGDPGRFRQIITNLVGNSIKFTERGHIFVTVHLVEEVMSSVEPEMELSRNSLSGYPVSDRRRSWEKFRTFNQDGSNMRFSSPFSNPISLIVSVEDTGVGIPLEAQARVFTPYMQVRPSISRTHGGTGIGLSISKCLVGLMNGEIGFVSTPKVGSTFTFTAVFGNGCPVSGECKSWQVNRRSVAVDESYGFHGMNALVIDSRPIRAKVTRYHLQRLGICVQVLSDMSHVLSDTSICNMKVNMVLVEWEIWDKDPSSLAILRDRLRNTAESRVPPKLFILANSAGSMRMSSSASDAFGPFVLMKPLRVSMMAASLQRAMGIGNKTSNCNGDSPSVSLRNLLQGRKILIVDDNRVNLRVAEGALKKYGADVVCAGSGKEAISLLKPPHNFDACFMDIQMPDKDGFETTKEIRQMERAYRDSLPLEDLFSDSRDQSSKWHLPILAMTADVIHATHEKCLEKGMNGHVSKPFEAEQLYREVSRFFHSSPDQNE
ncbi:hypothetical protein MLD38_017053 [Melastoma candidum]|uniref:Uncharacterized protein n=1 Tax=Melastoma candidum TaxID=119954 RepID=A0ACB9QNS5_9MYRT|nr:hypothetical protein MLD38_017053 [Melastoma candidum]